MDKKGITKQTTLAEVLRLGNECKRCNHCCRHGTGFLTKTDVHMIARHLKLTKEGFVKTCLEPVNKFNTTLYRPLSVKNKKQYGTCIFFNSSKGCTIHEVKPMHCRISSCNRHGEELSVWFHLNYFVNADDPESIRQWALYLESGGKNIPGGELEELVPDKEKLKKILNYEIVI